jgi:hypothetical protein
MITIYGASDDLVEVGGCEGADEFSADRWQGDLVAPGGTEQMRVHCWYDEDGCWQVGVGQVLEDCQLPAWPISITQAPAMNPDNPGYSALLSIDAPEGTRLENVKPKPEE